jgi:hypothetical protein
MLKSGSFMPMVLYGSIGSFGSNLTWDGTGKYWKYVHDSFPNFTHISNHIVRNLCKILIVYITANKRYGDIIPWKDFYNETAVQVNPQG